MIGFAPTLSLNNGPDRAVVDLSLQIADASAVHAQCGIDGAEGAADVVICRALDRIARRDELAAAVERAAEGRGDPLIGGEQLPAIDGIGAARCD